MLKCGKKGAFVTELFVTALFVTELFAQRRQLNSRDEMALELADLSIIIITIIITLNFGPERKDMSSSNSPLTKIYNIRPFRQTCFHYIVHLLIFTYINLISSQDDVKTTTATTNILSIIQKQTHRNRVSDPSST